MFARFGRLDRSLSLAAVLAVAPALAEARPQSARFDVDAAPGWVDAAPMEPLMANAAAEFLLFDVQIDARGESVERYERYARRFVEYMQPFTGA